MLKFLAIAMILVGGVLLLFTGDVEIVSEQVESAGNTVTINTEETIAWEPYVGGALLLGGFIIMATRRVKRGS
ncbi:hypothetical protein DJ568_05645 [Mucilaginibacter hurinus]|uniref:Uncharacterized protein n=1 Tax=Mucilaginibacter hurinus TaxID=2201324 RepID=A0A367GTQ9_9SPHI|nr:hypothetical protein [Mucilaginibacter hurinus]RCH56216.1 hypothetical protein DJ568_05645 [Mucilaginibacter hurinus]